MAAILVWPSLGPSEPSAIHSAIELAVGGVRACERTKPATTKWSMNGWMAREGGTDRVIDSFTLLGEAPCARDINSISLPGEKKKTGERNRSP